MKSFLRSTGILVTLLIMVMHTTAHSLHFAAYGDTRTNMAPHQAVINAISAVDPALVLNSGDLWAGYTSAQFMDIIQSTTRMNALVDANKYLVARGNHETEAEVLALSPTVVKNGHIEYSHTQGNCFFVSMGEDPNQNLSFLEQELSSAASQAATWRFIFAHYPVYSGGSHGASGIPAFEALCDKYHVTAFFGGHDHHYERTYLMHSRQIVTQSPNVNISTDPGTFYFVTGGGGAPLRGVTPKSWTAEAHSILHFMDIDAGNSQCTISAKDTSGAVIDQVVITKQQPIASGIALSPDTVRVQPGGSNEFSAYVTDQFGNNMGDASVTWSVTEGTISSQGVYQAPTNEGGPYILIATGTGSESSFSDTAVVFVQKLPPVALKINCGGPSVSEWSEDNSYTSGTAFTFGGTHLTTGVVSPAPNTVYQTVRHSGPTYTFGPSVVPNGDYTVRLHFTDGVGSVGDRSMTVEIESDTVLESFDIVAAAGGKYVAIVKDFDITVRDGDGMTIAFHGDAGTDAFIAGMEITTKTGQVTVSAPFAAPVLRAAQCILSRDAIAVSVRGDKAYRFSLYTVSGALVQQVSGSGPGKCLIPLGKTSAGVMLAVFEHDGTVVRKTITIR